MAKRARAPLNVFLNSRLVGRLHRQASGAIEFQYHPSWLEWANTLPVSLSLPLREDRYIGEPVIAVFDNLIPDNAQIRRRLAERSGANGDDAYSLLSAIGRDCVGALQFLPDDEDPGEAGRVDGTPISDEEIAAKLADLKYTPLGVESDTDFRISIAGAQDKTALLWWEGRWLMPHGTAATTHILKPEIGLLNNGIDLSQSIENEHFCMLLTAAFDLTTAKTEIVNFAGRKTLVIERFDRLRTSDKRLLRIPQEDCCQSLSTPPNLKYEAEGGPGMNRVLDLLIASDDSEKDRRAFIKSQVLFWLIGATDGHAKNFSVTLLPGGRFHLTPLYDVMSAQPNVDNGEIRHNRFKLAMSVGERRHYRIDTIAPRHFAETAKTSGIPKAVVKDVFDEIIATTDNAFSKAQAALPKDFPQLICDSISAAFRQRLKIAHHDW